MSRILKIGFAVSAAVVVAVASFVFLRSVNRPHGSNSKATRGPLDVLETAREEFRKVKGREVGGLYYPELMAQPASASILRKISPSNVVAGVVVDAWVKPMVYVAWVKSGAPGGYFMSTGPEGTANNTDDLRNTEAAN